MAFLGLFGNYDKPGPGVSKDETPKAAPIRFFEIYFRKFTKLVQANLTFLIPTIVAGILMVLLYLFPTHFMFQLPTEDGVLRLDVWNMYVVPLPVILLFPFMAGLTFICRNFAREEHAFIWSDFWTAVKNNWKYFLLNGAVVYLAYFLLSFSMIYYFNRASQDSLFYVPFWLCIVISVIFLFAQYYLPVMFITFDLKFGQVYKNALIFTIAGLGRNLLVTVILGVLVILIIGVIPIMPLTVLLLLLFFSLIFFSFAGFLINFAVYPIIDRYLIQPYQQKLHEEKYGTPKEKEKDPLEEKYGGLFSQEPEDEDGGEEEKFVYINGKLVEKAKLKSGEKERLDDDL